MNSDRLFPVMISPGLLDRFEPYVRIVVELADRPSTRGILLEENKPVDELETLLADWGHLGFRAAMPDQELFAAFSGDREKVFSSCGFRLNALHRKSDKHVEWVVHYDSISEAWLDVLLNCLESFHVRVTPIARVELASEVEDEAASPARGGEGPGDSAGGEAPRRRRWWPFGAS